MGREGRRGAVAGWRVTLRGVSFLALVGGPAMGCAGSFSSATSDAITPAADCPRDAARSASGRCACLPGQVVVLGACLPPGLGDLYCGPAATVSRGGTEGEPPADVSRGGGCLFRRCEGGAGETRDVATGACVSQRRAGATPPPACGAGGTVILEDGHEECVSSAETCPRGTVRGAGETSSACLSGPTCPPGSLLAGSVCRPITVAGGREGRRVDIGAWVAIVLGADEGAGSETLCRPIAVRPTAFAVPRGSALVVRLHISVVVPDQDIAQVHAEFRADGELSGASASGARGPSAIRANEGRGEHGLPQPAEDVVASAIGPLIEALRALGGESSAAAVDVTVHCLIANL